MGKSIVVLKLKLII